MLKLKLNPGKSFTVGSFTAGAFKHRSCIYRFSLKPSNVNHFYKSWIAVISEESETFLP